MPNSRVSRGWLPVLATVLVAGCATPYFQVDEAIRFEDGTTRFVAFAQRQRGWLLGGVEDVEVRFSVGDRQVASATTDERGFAKAVVDVDGPADRFAATAEFDGQDFRDEDVLVDWRSDRVIIACDIDSTISQTSLGALFFDELDETSMPIADSPEVLNELHLDFQLLYVTARPRFTLEKTRSWVEQHGYPIQPVVTSLAPRDALGQTTYKTRTLNSLRRHYENLLIGIGNTDIDAESYAIHGMLVLLVQPKVPPGRDGDVIRLQSWAQIRSFFAENRSVLLDPDRLRAAIRGEVDLQIPSS
ncbi:MAG: hypothetical protein QNK04_31435 [Myxococcota bacterium]|nr:hypothetical protein [Myxococcota bacterium]